jgi:hypothetical protein
MSVWPKSIFTIGASVLTARTARRLRRKDTAIPAQHRVLDGLVQRLAPTSFWQPAGLEAKMSYAQFKSRIPVRQYEDFAPAIDRMKAGEANVLWPGRCVFFAETSGTKSGPAPGAARYFPVTAEMRTHFGRAGMESLYYYAARVGNGRVFRGRHLFLGGSTALKPLLPANPLGACGGDLSGIAEFNLSSSIAKHFYEPGSAIAQLTDWPSRIDAIIRRTKGLDITLLAGIPSWVLHFAGALQTRSDQRETPVSHLQQIWPNLECLVHGGAPIAPFAEALRRLLGPTVNFHEVYFASEAFIAAQDAEARAGLRLMADAGVFYEFVPIDDFDETRPANLGGKAIPLEEVRLGVDYALLLTTPAGLCRYSLGDVVRFISIDPPRLQWIGRAAHQLTAFGERVIEKDVTDALIAICQRNGWTIVNFHVAPLFTYPFLGTIRGRHEWWVELRPGTMITPTGPQIAVELDIELQRTNPSYETKRKGHGLESPIVRLVMPGLFERWMRREGKWGGQHKVPRCRNDRAVADQLAALAQFAKD